MLKSTPRSWTDVTLYVGEDYARFQELHRAYLEAVALAPDPEKDAAPARMGDGVDTTVADAARALDEFKDAAAARGQQVRVVAPSRKTYRDLVAKHPPRPDNKADQRLRANADTFPDDFLPACLPLEGQFENADARTAWVENLSPGNFDRLYSEALKVAGETEVVDPLVSVSSRLGLTSGGSSEPPARLG